MKNKNKIAEIDKALVQLQDKVRQKTVEESEKKKIHKSQSKLPCTNNEEKLKTIQQSEKALQDLDKMQL